jgi:hypothetical protein
MEANLDDPAAWADLLDWKLIADLNAKYPPIEERLRQDAAALLNSKPGADADSAKKALIASIASLETGFNSENAQIIGLLSKNLSQHVSP